MLALTLNKHGDLGDVGITKKTLAHEPRECVLDLAYSALNHLDLFVVAGFPGLELSFPHTLGSDGAGTLSYVPTTSSFAVGDAVLVFPSRFCSRCYFCKNDESHLCQNLEIYGEQTDGCHAQQLVVEEENVYAIPEHLNLKEAAALPLTFLTAWRMLFPLIELKANDRLLIQGIGGGVALAALKLAKAKGAEVWVSSRDKEKCERAKSFGADHALTSEKDMFKTVLKETAGIGVDAIIDSVGAATWPESLRSLRRGGRLATCGATTGDKTGSEIRRIFWNQLQILGSTMGSKADFEAMLAFVSTHKIKPVIDRVFDLDDGVLALKYLQSQKQMGKVLLKNG